ncbi:MAG: hypothetical protein ACPG31_00615 [Planctomycetota bacterium]
MRALPLDEFSEDGEPPKQDLDNFLSGFLGAMFLMIAVQGGLFLLAGSMLFLQEPDTFFMGMVLALAVGWTQLLYMPLFIWRCLRIGNREQAKGATFLLLLALIGTSLCASSM